MYTSIAFVLEQTHRTFWMWNKTKVFFSPFIPRSILMTELFPCMYFWRCIFIVGPSPIRDSTLDFRWRRFLCETLFESKLVPCTHTHTTHSHNVFANDLVTLFSCSRSLAVCSLSTAQESSWIGKLTINLNSLCTSFSLELGCVLSTLCKSNSQTKKYALKNYASVCVIQLHNIEQLYSAHLSNFFH